MQIKSTLNKFYGCLRRVALNIMSEFGKTLNCNVLLFPPINLTKLE